MSIIIITVYLEANKVAQLFRYRASLVSTGTESINYCGFNE